MNFELNEVQLMIRDMTREFAQKEIAPQARRNDREGRFPRELLAQMAPLGLLGAPIPQEYGGMGLDHLSWGIALEQIAGACMSTATIVLVQASLVGLNLLNWATPEQRSRYLPLLASGKMIGSFCLTEPNAGSNPAQMETAARRDGDAWVLNGQKLWITNGAVADLLVVYAQTDQALGHRGVAAFLVERSMAGVSAQDIQGKLGLRASNTAAVFFDEVRVPAANLMAESSRFNAACAFVGLAQAALDAAVAYAAARMQFGHPIGAFQMVQDIIADMVTEVEAARCLAYRAGALKDRGTMTARDASMAKYYASEVAVRTTERAVQIHGAAGYSDALPVERYFRDARVATIYEGTSQMQKLIIGRETLGLSAFS
ncbi:MAG: acyl-CoA dehydrogenase family protein [Chloroflexi bacterium]|nr:acyl-CoA dehydrogenase family protein [Chloroflexota bacterium]